MGGGFQGSRLGFITFADNGNYVAAEFNRVFDARGNQTSVVRGSFGDGGVSGAPAPASYILDINGPTSTGFFAIDQSTSLLSSGGLQPVDPPGYPQYYLWTYPQGWYVVGAPANDTAELPWK